MNGAHLHLMINHFPLVGLLFGLVILVVAQLRRNSDLARTGLVALVIIAIITIPAYLTGEPAHDIVHDLAGISDEILERHEWAALIALALAEIVGIIALYGLVAFRPPKELPGWFVPTLLVLCLIAVAWLGYTSSLGGQISHEETRPGFQIVGE
jgi:uncharacterized membrane protein